jgi:hypothetical protein
VATGCALLELFYLVFQASLPAKKNGPEHYYPGPTGTRKTSRGRCPTLALALAPLGTSMALTLAIVFDCVIPRGGWTLTIKTNTMFCSAFMSLGGKTKHPCYCRINALGGKAKHPCYCCTDALGGKAKHLCYLPH